MATLPNPRGRSTRVVARRRGSRLGKFFAGTILALFVLGIVLPVLGDAANGLLKPAPACRVMSLTDGDTGRLFCAGNGFVTARFLGYDTPELYSAKCLSERLRAVAATYALRWQLWRAGEIVARPRGTDRYGRRLTVLAVDGVNPGRYLVEAGLARWYDGGPRREWCA